MDSPDNWWQEVAKIKWQLTDKTTKLTRPHHMAQYMMHAEGDTGTTVADTVKFDTRGGRIYVGRNVIIDDFVKIVGPCYIGDNTIIGTGSKLTCADIGAGCLVGMGAEVKNSRMADGASIGPYSYLADSIMKANAFFGALVRTSNYRLDGHNVTALVNGESVDTGMRKLGCVVGENANLGVGCAIYPGRIVPAYSIFGPGVQVNKNFKPGRYTVKQELDYKPL